LPDTILKKKKFGRITSWTFDHPISHCGIAGWKRDHDSPRAVESPAGPRENRLFGPPKFFCLKKPIKSQGTLGVI
jgi:hypothetical protein